LSTPDPAAGGPAALAQSHLAPVGLAQAAAPGRAVGLARPVGPEYPAAWRLLPGGTRSSAQLLCGRDLGSGPNPGFTLPHRFVVRLIPGPQHRGLASLLGMGHGPVRSPVDQGVLPRPVR